MTQDDINYILELLEEATENKEWELIEESIQYLKDFSKEKGYSIDD